MSGLQLLMYLAVVFFVVGTLYKAIRINRMPLHIRWDLYPIPHEKGKGHYGGSYFEEVDWWTKPSETSTASELSEMGKEMIFIQSMFHHNRSLWMFSFPFHFGLYLLVGFVVLMILGGILEAAGVAVNATGAGGFGAAIYYLSLIAGMAGSILMTLGAFGLFLNRMFKSELRASAVWTDYFNLLLLMATGLTLFLAGTGADSGFHNLRGFVAGAVTMGEIPPLDGMVAAHIVLAAVFMLWLPFTHMTHFVGKYFTYHKVRWEDHPNVRGGKIEKQVTEALGYRVSWSADHIKTGGTWAEAATATDNEEGEKK